MSVSAVPTSEALVDLVFAPLSEGRDVDETNALAVCLDLFWLSCVLAPLCGEPGGLSGYARVAIAELDSLTGAVRASVTGSIGSRDHVFDRTRRLVSEIADRLDVREPESMHSTFCATAVRLARSAAFGQASNRWSDRGAVLR